MVRTSHTIKALSSLFLMLFIFSCQKDNPDNDVQISNDFDYLELNESPGNGRIQSAKRLLIWHGKGLDKEGLGGQIEDRDGEPTPDDDMYWLHIGDVAPLVHNGVTLSATHVVVKDDIAYVSYHARGEEHLGAVESIDLADPEEPEVIHQIFFNSADVNAIEVDQAAPATSSRIWVALSDSKKGAILGELPTQSGNFTGEFNFAALSNLLPEGISASANSIEHAGNYLYVTAGKSHGGVFMFDPNRLNLLGKKLFADAKYVVSNGTQDGVSKVAVLQAGVSSALRIESLGTAAFATESPIGEISHQNTDAASFGKSTLHFQANGSNILYAAMGTAGLKAFNINGGVNEIWHSPSEMLANGNCNGITTANGFLYAANGADGLAVFQLSNSADPKLVFIWDLNEKGASANFVETAGDFVFVAKGQGGLKILKRPAAGDLLPLTGYDDNGTPLDQAEQVVVCQSLVPTIYANALPEGQNAMNKHPEFFKNDVVDNIVLKENCEVFLTFVNEGAGYKNTLGYYYYDVNNPPKKEEDLTKIIIFPNASAVGSGGDLVPGSTMELLGTFNKNTVIGFFVISDGWRNGQLTNGYYTLYSDPKFNQGKKTQSLIFHDQSCSSTVLCFEDILTTGGDKDFNDLIFQVTTSPASAINPSQYLQL